MDKLPKKEAPTDPLEINVQDDPNYDGPELSDEDLNPQEDAEDSEDDAPDGDETDDEDAPDTEEPDTSDDEDPDAPGDDEDPDDAEDDSDDEEDDTVSMEDYKKLQSSTTKGAQKLLGTIKSQKKAMNMLPELADDQSKLLKVYEEEPEVASIILQEYYGGIGIEEFAKDYLGQDYKPKEEEKSNLSEEEIRTNEREKVKAEMLEDANNDYLGELIVEAGVSKKQAKEIMEEYKDIVNGRSVDKTKVKKYFQTAYYSIVGTSKSDPSTKVVKSTSKRKGSGGKSKDKKGTSPKHVQDSVNRLKSMT